MEPEKLKLSNQALGAFMMTLQKCLMQQADITGILQDLDFYVSDENEIICTNPPTLEFSSSEQDWGDDYEWDEGDELEEQNLDSFANLTKIED